MYGIQTYIDRLISDSTPEKPLWNIEKVNSGKQPYWNYIDGCMMSALYELYIITGENKYFNFVKNYIDYYVADDGSIKTYDKNKFNLDDINEGRVLFDLYGATGDERYKKAIFNLYEQLKEQPRTETGNFWHKKIYPNQIWLDGIYMAQPFYCRYLTAFGGCDYQDLLSQIENVRALMFDEKAKLYYHGIDCSKTVFWANEKGLSQSFWLRSIGWFLVALADLCEFCHDGKVAKKLSGILKEALIGVSNYVDKKTGMLYQVPDKSEKEGNYPETSGSLMVSYALMKAYRLGIVQKEYGVLGKNVYDAVVDRYLKVSDNGDIELGGICLVAGLGPENNLRRNGTYEYYISEPVVKNDAKGVAPLVMCYAELKRFVG